MLITVINPNTTAAMTQSIGACARAVAGPGTRIAAVNPAGGPASIESSYDDALSVPGVLAEIAAGPRADAYVLACFGDPGLDAARELATGPVIGIAEAAMRTAAYLGSAFSVVTTLRRTVPHTQRLIDRYGVRGQCRSVRATDIAVLDLDSDPDTFKLLRDEAREAIESDGADVIVLGCAGMAGLAAALQDELGVPVIDGVVAAVCAAESLVRMGLSTSRAGEYAPPGSQRARVASNAITP